MKTKAELEQDIISITIKIHTEFPELSKYIAEMPENESGRDTDRMSKKNFKEYYNSLLELLLEYSKTHSANNAKNGTGELNSLDNLLYPPSEDIYNKGKKEIDLDPENPSKRKSLNEIKATSNEKGFEDDMSGDDLDVPGSELDDQQESVGSEDEENNYYSLGGDSHNDLDEDKG
ncbi:hypothetical protein QLS71_012320 [Mariniflexile litorale]|uniref:Uncharacterized protein n=1 Tax=Mariniflexile litorale TaxID=3045158 RepID=A0AAU7ECG8_9FLAO|nr:hypothetical protein [Mariniflexile sp. KMM 9835]MDQ8210444.1 hypothetical protein [Mariniflexile sp. KMM 9835]